jgi:hypothetical protein
MPRKRFAGPRARSHAERHFEELAGIAERAIQVVAEYLRLAGLPSRYTRTPCATIEPS